MKSYRLFILLVFILLITGFSEAASAQQANHQHDHGSSFSLFSLVEPLGIATLSCVTATFLTGLFRRKLARRFLKIHLLFAIVSVILGFTHGILVLVLF